MAEGKKSVLMYCDLIHTVKKLTDEQAGKLFKHYLEYVNDLEPKADDLIVEIAFEPIKQQLKRDLDKWQEKKVVQSEKGREGNLKRWNLDLYNKVKEGKITLEEAEEIAKNRKASPPDKTVSPPIANIAVNDNVNVTVNDNVKDIIKEEFVLFWDSYKKKTGKDKCFKKFMSLTNSEREQIKQKLPTYIKSTPELKYRKDPYTWLNGKHWEDEIELKAKKQNTTPYASPII